MYHKEEKYPLGNKRQNVKEDQKDLVKESSNNKSVRNIPFGYIPEDRLFGSELSSPLREIRFNKQEFLTGTSISDIKYNYLEYKNDNLFYLFNDQLEYTLAHYFAESETTKDNVDRFLSNLLIAPLIEKLFYQNIELIEKLLKIP